MKKALQKFFAFLKNAPLLALVFGCLTAYMPQANAAQITSMRIGQQVGSVRIVLESDKAFDYQAFLLNNPNRLVVDAYNGYSNHFASRSNEFGF